MLVGATGDLSRRKLLPGLFHLSNAGFIPGCRIIGVSLDDLDADGFRKVARGALDQFSSRKVKEEDWIRFADTLDYVPMSAGPEVLKAAVERAEASFVGESRLVHYLSVPPGAALSAVRLLAEAGLVERSRIIMEKPFGTDLASAVSLNAKLHEVFAEDRIFRIDHFPRQGAGAEHPGVPLRQRAVRADLEPELHRPRADRRARDPRAQSALALLRSHGRLSRHGRDPPVPDPRLHGHGASDLARAGADQRGEEQGLPQHAADRPEGCRARPICGLPLRGRRRPRIRDRDVHRPQMYDRQLALGRRAVLPADGQEAGRGSAHHLDRLPRAPEEHVPGGLRRRCARPRPPDVRSRGRLEDVALLLWQTPRARHAARQAELAVRHARHGARRRGARSLRAPDPRRDARRPYALHHRRRHRAPVGGFGSP